MAKPSEFKEKLRSISFVGTRLRDSRLFDREREKLNDAELDQFERVCKEGSLPDGTQMWQSEKAKAWSDTLGVPYRGDDVTGMLAHAGVAEARELSEKEKQIANPKRGG